jgi:hypothetical protein
VSRTITIDVFDPASVSRAAQEIRQYAQWVQRKTEELAKRLAEYGLRRVQVGYAAALYDVDKTQRDVVLSVEERGVGQYAIVAYGYDVLLLEFGSGVVYGGGHPLNSELGMGPGTFPGQTHVPTPGYWWYKGEDGKSHYSVGNAPSMVMYLTGMEMEREVERIAREVFST